MECLCPKWILMFLTGEAYRRLRSNHTLNFFQICWQCMILVLRSTPKYEFISKKASCAGCLISSWGFRCCRLTVFHFLLETATSIFSSLLIHLFLLLVTIRDYSQYSVVIRVWSMANDGRLVSIPAFVSNSHPFPMAKLFIITHSVC